MVIGVTGTSGSGKTSVSAMLRDELKGYLIDADKVVRQMQKQGNDYYNQIVKGFGKDILTENQEINRAMLRDLIFGDEIKREKLNEITNYYVVEEIRAKVNRVEQDGKNVIVDVPRLIESGLDDICDILIAVIAKEDIKIDRICKRDQIDIQTARRRLAAQPKDEFYLESVNYIIENNYSDLELELQVHSIIEKMY